MHATHAADIRICCSFLSVVFCVVDGAIAYMELIVFGQLMLGVATYKTCCTNHFFCSAVGGHTLISPLAHGGST